MMNWEISITSDAPEKFKSDKFKLVVEETMEPCIRYIYDRIGDISKIEFNYLSLEIFQFSLLKLFREIVDDLPILSGISIVDKQGVILPIDAGYKIENIKWICIRYNKWINIIITDSIEQIYRDYKLNKILENE